MSCINTFGRVRYFPDQAKKKIQNGRTSTLIVLVDGFLFAENTSGIVVLKCSRRQQMLSRKHILQKDNNTRVIQ